ncbi:MAG: flagellar hook assembly protein FlgD [Treponema sp.]|nr:MAG: flagellar hook assembly protein FlgD [Treponema sp.]
MPTWEMSEKEKSLLQLEVDRLNKKEFGSRMPKQELGKDDFLQLLIAQLQHQDPTSPMEDAQFIAQMAQFSSLEQMTNLSNNFEKLAKNLTSSDAVGVVGKKVGLEIAGEKVSGIVTATRRGEIPEVLVNGTWHSWDSVKTIYSGNTN